MSKRNYNVSSRSKENYNVSRRSKEVFIEAFIGEMKTYQVNNKNSKQKHSVRPRLGAQTNVFT